MPTQPIKIQEGVMEYGSITDSYTELIDFDVDLESKPKAINVILKNTTNIDISLKFYSLITSTPFEAVLDANDRVALDNFEPLDKIECKYVGTTAPTVGRAKVWGW